MTLRLRLILFLSALFVLVMLVAAWALLLNTRDNVGAESRAAHALVHALLAEHGGEPRLAPASAAVLAQTRHLRVIPDSPEPERAAPAWFERLVVAEALPAPIEARVGDAAARMIRVQADARDEVLEAWDDLSDAALFVIALLLALIAGTFLIVRREMAPLGALAAALQQVEAGSLDVRLPAASLPELERLRLGFNRMAAALHESRRENLELTRRLIHMQEDERRTLARELHDEFGQHLTAIRAEAAALLAPGVRDITARSCGLAIETAGANLMRMLRSMLSRLRPESLDAFGLAVALEDLVAEFRARNPDVVVHVRLPERINADENASIALFRVAQEALTNITRHARANRVSLTLESSAGLRLRVEDDGVGLAAQGASPGFGLAGMRERMAGCGGSLQLARGAGGAGTVVEAFLPASIK